MKNKNYLSTLLLLLILSSCGQREISQDYFVEDENPNYAAYTYALEADQKLTTTPIVDSKVKINSTLEPKEVSQLESLLEIYSSENKEQRYCGDHITLQEIVVYGSMIKNLGGLINDPSNYENDLIGFQKFLNDSGVKYFSAYEMTTPGTRSIAKFCGDTNLIPPQGCWLRSASIALLSDSIRGDIESPVTMTSHYRSSCYNQKLGGARKSDHLEARAADLKYKKIKFRQNAMDFICKKFWEQDVFGLSGLESQEPLNISIGIGYTYTHIGLGSVRGRRYWIYKSFINNEKLPDSCWTKSLIW